MHRQMSNLPYVRPLGVSLRLVSKDIVKQGLAPYCANKAQSGLLPIFYTYDFQQGQSF